MIGCQKTARVSGSLSPAKGTTAAPLWHRYQINALSKLLSGFLLLVYTQNWQDGS